MAKWGKILSIREFRKIGDTGDIETWVKYQVKSAGGTVFTEDIKKDEATEEKVAEVLKTRAESYDAQLKL